MSILTKILGDPNEKIIQSLRPTIEKINSFEPDFKKMSDEELKRIGSAFRQRLEKVGNPDEILPEAFAAAREASRRTIGLRHYDVQLLGGIILHRGQIAEMRTGEGKTLVATLPLSLNAFAGKGAHLVTVNDYLAKRDAAWMAPVYLALGLSVGVVTHEAGFIYDPDYSEESQYDERLKKLRPVSRREAYQADITYGTNNEFGFDYLRDNMVPKLSMMVQRDLYYAIVDEVDSILIDEARTPLIISAPAEESTDKYYQFAELVSRLKENEDYNVDEKLRSSTLTEEGMGKMEKWLGVDNIYTAGGVRDAHHIEQALKARVLFKRDRDYVVKDGEVIIVDEFTGRLMHGRRYSEGLHQAIEAKEGVKIQRESQTLATITFQNYFRLYSKLAGMTGTALTEAEEFSKIYKLETVSIPTNRPMIREDLNDLIYKSEEGKLRAVVEEVKRRSEFGQPVLIGTISIEKNEILAGMLERRGLRPEVLNAKNHEREAQIIAQAGRPGAVTIATNMAGRGVDIILGGNPMDEAAQKKVVELGGLHVIGTERHEARRIDNQLRGRAGRQGDPGSSQFYLSTEDDLMRIFGGDRMKSVMARLKVPEDMPIENKLISRSIEAAQRKVEGNNFDIRKHLVEYDDVINKHRESVYRRRREILNASERKDGSLTGIALAMIKDEIERIVSFHTAAEKIGDWNLKEIYETVNTIFPVDKKFEEKIRNLAAADKLDKAKRRTEIIEFLEKESKEKYEAMKKEAAEAGVDWEEMEREILLRSIDTMWIDHLEAMDYMRRGIGLRGYGQRDPLVEYKKEAYRMFSELNELIEKQVVYGIYKIGAAAEKFVLSRFVAPAIDRLAKNFSAPAKTMEKGGQAFSGGEKKNKDNENIDLVRSKIKNDEGEKIGRNDPCPCGSGKKYKKCHGR